MVLKNGKSRYQVPNLERALSIMEYMVKSDGSLTMAEIARNLGYPNNSVFRIMSTLEECGYLIKDTDSKHFRISRKLLSLGYQALIETSLIEKAADTLRALRDETRETALLGTLLEGEGVVLEQFLSPEPIKFMVSPGTRFPLHTAAPAKAIMAFLDEPERERQIGMIKFIRHNERTIVSANAYRKELQKVRKLGYGCDCGEDAKGIICVGAPVFDYRNRPVAAIWITGPEFRLPENSIPATGAIVAKHARDLSSRLGGSGN